VTLYGGDFLDAFDPKAQSFQDWILAERARLRARALGAMSRLLARYMNSSATDPAIALAVRLLAIDPLQEPVHRTLMQLYARQGRAASALRQFQICREILQRELATSPDPATETLYREILAERRARSKAVPETSTGGASAAEAAALLHADATPPPVPRPQTAAAPESEIRQATVMACEMGEVAGQGGEADPEQARLLADRFHELTRGIVESYGGTIERPLDDSAVALFGIPAAHTDDSERAVRAALQIREAIRFLGDKNRESPSVQIGIADGRLLVSRVPGDGARQFNVSGRAIGAATRISASAASDEVLVTESVYQQVSELVFGAQRRVLAHGGEAPRRTVWRITDIRNWNPARSLFVGREPELAQFEAALEASRDRQRGLTIVVRGEAGIGKSRLVEEFGRRARAEGYHRHTGLVLDFGVGRGEGAIPAVVRGLIGAAPELNLDREAIDRAKAGGLVGPDREMFLYELLQIGQPNDLRALFGALDDKNRRRLTRETLVDLVRRASARQPCVIVVEDLHWANPATLELADAISEAVTECPAILIVTTRTDGDPVTAAWRGKAGSVIAIDLRPLNFDEASALAGAVIDAADPFAIRCVERSGGNPFLLDQLLRHRGGDDSLPGSVHTVVQARMDRLDPVDRKILKVASVLGQRFSTAGLAAVIGPPQPDCSGLVGQGLLKPDGEDYRFAHALVQESAYQSLPKSERKELHLQAAAWLRSRDPVLYASHLDRADHPAAAPAYLDAALSHAREYRYESALLLIQRGEELATRPSDRFALAWQRGELLQETGAVAEAASAYEAALALAADDAERARAYVGRAAVKRLTDDLPGAFADVERAEEVADRLELSEIAARAHLLHGNLLFPRGDIAGCLREHELGLELAARAGSHALQAAALGGIADAEYMRGRMRTVGQRFKGCVRIARDHGLGRIAVANQPMLAVTRWYCGETAGALADALEAIDAAAKVAHRRAEAVSHHVAYVCRHSLMDLAPAWENVRVALALAEQLKAPRFEAEALGFRAELHRLSGRRSAALADVGRALAISRAVGMDYMGPILVGTLALATDDPAVRAAALAEGDALLAANAVAHNHFLFRRDAIEACLESGDYDEARRHALALADFARFEPLPWTEFVVARAHALAAFGRGERSDKLVAEIRRLRREASERGYLSGLGRIEAALLMTTPTAAGGG
jgi:predicted ATPase/class 3 adenylate cyclase